MAAVRTRRAIASPDAVSVAGVSPLAMVTRILGVRIFDVGQGDSLAILGDVAGSEQVVVQLDYGGRERNPFKQKIDVDVRMPVSGKQFLMLSHGTRIIGAQQGKAFSRRKQAGLCPAS